MGDDEKKRPEPTDEEVETLLIKLKTMSIREELRREFELKYAKKQGKKVGVPRLRAANVDKYIAAVSLALLRRDVEPATANVMLYAAQLLLAATRVMPPKRERKKRLEEKNIIDGGSLG
jgi:hypothetical protein